MRLKIFAICCTILLITGCNASMVSKDSTIVNSETTIDNKDSTIVNSETTIDNKETTIRNDETTIISDTSVQTNDLSQESIRDSSGQLVSLSAKPKRVLALSASVAEIWLLAGGELSGVTDDAVNERGFSLSEDVVILGTVKAPSMEEIMELDPDLVLLSQDIESHMALSKTLMQANMPYYAAKVDTLEEYSKVLKDFTIFTGDQESFAKNGEQVKLEVDELLAHFNVDDPSAQPTALFLRAFSTGVKPKAYEHTVCTILEDIHVVNIAAKEGFPLDDLSLEAILEAEQDFIFVVSMGEEEAALESLNQSLLSNPAFAELSAIKNDKLYILPKDLFHYKPNHRWGEAYAYLLKIIYPQVFSES